MRQQEGSRRQMDAKLQVLSLITVHFKKAFLGEYPEPQRWCL